ncbi:unnamed protein product, partial [Rotaria sp. Silwood1]
LGVSIDKSIKQKNSSERYRDQIFIYAPFLDGKFKLHWITESSLPLETKTVICDKIKNLIYDHSVVLQRNDCSTATHEVNVTYDPQLTTLTTPRSTPKRKHLFSYIDHKNIKKQKVDSFAFIKDEITSYLNDDDSDSQKFILLNQSIKYKTSNQLARKVLTVPATSTSVERIFPQSGFIFR